MIKEHVNVELAGTFLGSMIMYKTVVNLYTKSLKMDPNGLKTL
jgi:hypothetical protein